MKKYIIMTILLIIIPILGVIATKKYNEYKYKECLSSCSDLYAPRTFIIDKEKYSDCKYHCLKQYK